MTKPDYSRLNFRCNGFIQDSFSLAVSQAANLFGHEVSYEDVLALSTNAFAPGFDTGNDCKELWVANAWVSHLGLAEGSLRQLGLRIEPIKHPEHPADPSKPEYRQILVSLVRKAMSEGKVVVTSGGWECRKEWVEPWWAGIIVEATDAGVVYGAHPNGRTDCELEHLNSGELFAVSPVERGSLPPEANAILLRKIVQRIRAKGAPGGFARHEFCAFGVDAMDDWIAQMTNVLHFCPVCYEKKGTSWQNAELVAQSLMHRCRIAAKWLQLRSMDYPEAARPHLIEASQCYSRIVALLEPSIRDAAYKEIIGKRSEQANHAEAVLKPIRAALVAAADAFQNALAATEQN